MVVFFLILGWERFSRAISEAELSSGGAAGGFRAGRVTGSGLRLTQELKISETLLNNEGAALALQPCHLICGVARCCGVLLPLDEEHRISCAPGGLFSSVRELSSCSRFTKSFLCLQRCP